MNDKFLVIKFCGVRYSKPMPQELVTYMSDRELNISSIYTEFIDMYKNCNRSNCETCWFYFHTPQMCWFDMDVVSSVIMPARR